MTLLTPRMFRVKKPYRWTTAEVEGMLKALGYTHEADEDTWVHPTENPVTGDMVRKTPQAAAKYLEL